MLLVNLPPELLEQICERLSIRDRVRLTSCCRALWRLGRDSSALWVKVGLQWRGQAALLRWLLRRRPQLRHLRLELGESGCLPRDVLAVLAGGPLLSVDLSVACSPGGCAQRACGLDTGLPLPSFCLNLPNLRELCISEEGIVLGSGLQALTQLTRLSVAGGKLSAPDCLPSSLAALELRDWRRSMPTTLLSAAAAAAPMLRSLRVVQCGVSAALPGLAALTALTELSLEACLLRAAPPQLANMTTLRRLSLAANPCILGLADTCSALTALTHLDLRHCDLAAFPLALAEELGGSLRQLRLCGNGGADLQGLAALSALSALSLRACALQRLPEELADLCMLRVLDVSGNLPSASNFRVLSGARQLAWLRLSPAQAGRNWPGLAPLASLTRLDLQELPAVDGAETLSKLPKLLELGVLRSTASSTATTSSSTGTSSRGRSGACADGAVVKGQVGAAEQQRRARPWLGVAAPAAKVVEYDVCDMF